MKAQARIRRLAAAGATALTLFCVSVRAQVAKQMQQRTLKPSPLKNATAYNGKISGIVYWDTTKVVRNKEGTVIDVMTNTETTFPVPPGCDGTEVYVLIADQYDGWETTTSTFSYSTDGSLAKCAYTIDRVPVGQPLLVVASVPSAYYSFKTGAGNLSSSDVAAVPASGVKGSYWLTWGGSVGGVGAVDTVANIPCRDLVSSASIGLASASRSCGGEATNVNFVIGSYSDYLKSLLAEYGMSTQQLSAAQTRVLAQIARPRQALSGGALIAQSANSPNTGASAQRAPMSAASPRSINPGPTNTPSSTPSQRTSSPTTTPRLTNAEPAPAPMLGKPGQPLLANGGTPGALMEQAPGTTNATMASGSRTATSAAGTAVTPGTGRPSNGGAQAGPSPIPAKGNEHNGYEAVTVQRGVTSDPNFTKWTNSANHNTLPANATNICLNKAFIRAVNGNAVSQAPFAAGVVDGGVIGGVFSSNVIFTPGKHYIISGCGFGTTPGKIYLLGQFPAHGGKIMLEPFHASATSLRNLTWGSQWSERQIDAEIDPRLSGELSESHIALVIETSTGATLRAFGLNFAP